MAKPIEPNPQVLNPSSRPRKLFIVLKSQEQKQPTEIDRQDDFTDEIKNSMVEYVSDATRRNDIPIVSGLHDGKLYSGNGNPTAIVTGDENGQRTFLTETDETAVRSFRTLSNAGQIAGFSVKKGQEESTAPTYVQILNDVNTNTGNSDLAKKTGQTLSDNGLYSESQPFATEDQQFDDENTILGGISQPQGIGAPRKFPDVSSIKQDNLIAIKDMKKLALLTMLQSTGELVQPNLSNSQDAITSIGQASTLVPGIARIGGLVSTSRFAPKNVIKAIKPTLQTTTTDNSLLSYGNTNSYFVPFDGLTNAPSILSATIMMTTVAGLLKSLSLLRLVRQGQEFVVPYGDAFDRQRWLGSYRGQPRGTDVLSQPLEFSPTEHEFFTCLDKGISVFFGLDTSDPLTFIGGATSQITKLHGYYNVVLRNVIRSVNELVVPTAQVLGDGQGQGYRADPLDVRNVADPITNLKKLNNSALVKFINMMIVIGDRSLTLEEIVPGATTDSTLLLTEIDNIDEKITVPIGNESAVEVLNPAILVAKNRLSERAGGLAIGNTTLRSLLLLPSNVLQASEAYNGTADMNAVGNDLASTNTVVSYTDGLEQNQPRIKASIVEQIENYLERDYMPFYFHDIRTNEILSFHAFLGDITDNLSVDYTETEGYGRVGGVYTYKNTKREIGIQFKLLAISENDFDQMWYKLNRLAAMLYPQWTEGRRVSFGANNKFIQPFSQVPGASPLIRIRLGDIFKSNYSKFAAARLFGLANGIGQDGAFNLQNSEADASSAQANRTRQQEAVDRARRIYAEQQRGNYQSATPTTDQAQATQRVRLHGGGRTFRRADGHGTTPRIQGDIDVRIVGVVNTSNHDQLYRVTALQAITRSQPPSPRANPQNQPDFTTTEFVVAPSDLIPNMNYIISSLRGPSAGTTGTPTDASTNESGAASQEITNFFDPERNPIMKSFESTKGRGLAGFIRSMNLDYKEATWVTDKANGRAPLLVGIDINFTPIHDIQPGLDSNGFMTAPIWNVGNIMGNMHDATALQNSMTLLQQARSNLTRR